VPHCYVEIVSEIASKLALRRDTDRSPALRRLGWYHSFEFPDGSTIEGVQTIAQLKERWARFPLPSDLSGKRVLDIGAWDGWFSFEAERRGAEVVSVDCVEIPHLLAAREKLGSQIDYRITDLYKLPRLQLGVFDYVLFLGVLYHVKHPMLALEIVCAHTRDIAIVESAVIDGPQYEAGLREEIPTLEFFETDELGGHFDNWFGPSVECMMAMCRAVGFARVELLSVTATTASVACYRHWPEAIGPFHQPAPELAAVVNNADLGINVSRDNDDYLTWWFTCDTPLTRSDLQFDVGGFGCHAVSLTKREGNGWSANTILPPGIARGWVTARMRTTASPYSAARRIAVDVLPEIAGEIVLDAVQDGETWEKNRLSPHATYAVLWVRGLGVNCDRANVAVLCNGTRLLVDFVGDPDENDARQVNARLPEEFQPDVEIQMAVRYAGSLSNTVKVTR
jgi:tRNA (mo5U34)-methyltransferase